jgi:hypothetical protein
MTGRQHGLDGATAVEDGDDGSMEPVSPLLPAAWGYHVCWVRSAPAGGSAGDSYRNPHGRNLSPGQGARLRGGPKGGALHELAAEFGVSHETVRTVLARPADDDPMALAAD